MLRCSMTAVGPPSPPTEPSARDQTSRSNAMTTQKTQSGQKSGNQFAQNPFLAFDVNQMMAAFDPAKFAGEFAKLTDRYQVPGFDMEAMAESHRRNVEALD